MASNGAAPPSVAQDASQDTSTLQAVPPRVILAGATARILCVADIRGDYHELNRLIKVHNASAVIHTGDFGFNEQASLERMGDRIIRHLVRYSPLLATGTRAQYLAPSLSKEDLISQLSSAVPFPLSQFPHLVTGAITFPVPVFTVWGLVEDVRILEKFRTGEYEVKNLTVLDEVMSRVIDVAGLRLRLFGLGGAFIMHRMFDNGEGLATIAGGQGTVWSTALQIGELVDTAQRVYDPSETRILITHAPISREGFLSQLSLVLKADLTISSGMHFRYGASYNDFIIQPDFDSYIRKLTHSRSDYKGVWDSVKDRVEGAMNPYQTSLLQKTQLVANRVPTHDDGVWKNTWNWQLADAACSQLVLSISEGRVSAETKSAGLNFSHRVSQSVPPSSTSVQPPSSAARPVTADGPQIRQPGQSKPVLAETSKTPQVPVPAVNGHAVPRKPQLPVQPPPQPKGAPTPTAPKQASTPVVNGTVSKATPPPAAKASETSAAFSKPLNGSAKGRDPPASATPRGAQANGKSASIDRTKPATPTTAAPTATPDTPAATSSSPAPAESVTGDTTEATESNPAKPAFQPRQHNPHTLFIKNIPVPSTEQDIKDLFTAGVDKITRVKLLHDMNRRQKTFCYVEYGNEEDMKLGLENHGDKIRDTVVDISISNPPVHREDSGFRGGRGRGRGGRGSRGGSGFPRGGGPAAASAPEASA